MFETLMVRAARAAEGRARRRAAGLAEELRAALPPEVQVAADSEGVRLSGRGLGRRRALDAALRWTFAGLIR